ncbi:MAG TPA: phosphatidylglycerophosphatase A [Burkholderiales bacterium]|jgi:phosphatidylglycerophosphatase A|nr:phosphatidylglycerophosphatase A [Burkholderiales bacterium]
MIAARPTPAFAFSHPAHVLAFGFGAGLSPLAPGTAGTALAWVLGWLLGGIYAPSLIVALAAVLFVVGVWACGVTGRRLGAADHGAMVWDEMVAFLLVIALIPRELAWQAGAFVLFRIFDILKPPPIRSLERRFHNGFGVMLDDLVAAGYVLVALALARRLAA